MKRSWIASAALLGSLMLIACGEDPPNVAEPSGSVAAEPSGPTQTEPSGPTQTEPSGPTQTEPSGPAAIEGPGGRIVFVRGDPSEGVLAGEGVTYIVNADGSDVRPLFSDGSSADPMWSPDGTEIHIFCCDDGAAAHVIDPMSGELRRIPPPDPALETFCGGAWTPDGKRLACESFGVDDPSRNGIYSIRVADGGGLSRITTDPGGDDIPGDYSPDGNRLVFLRSAEDGRVGIFVTDVDGSGVRRISPPGVLVDDTFAGSWSPTDDRILLVARDTQNHHKAIWIVNADGSSPHALPIAPGCGGALSDPKSFGCYSPGWSPDGRWITFARSTPDGSAENIWIVNADGSGLVQLTDGGLDDRPDWGPDPAP